MTEEDLEHLNNPCVGDVWSVFTEPKMIILKLDGPDKVTVLIDRIYGGWDFRRTCNCVRSDILPYFEIIPDIYWDYRSDEDVKAYQDYLNAPKAPSIPVNPVPVDNRLAQGVVNDLPPFNQWVEWRPVGLGPVGGGDVGQAYLQAEQVVIIQPPLADLHPGMPVFEDDDFPVFEDDDFPVFEDDDFDFDVER